MTSLIKFGRVGAAAGLFFALCLDIHAIEYKGSLNGGVGGGITATDGWSSPSTVFSWDVKSIGTSGGYILWQYDYTFTVPKKDISHAIIEVSDTAQDGDFTDLLGNMNIDKVKEYSSSSDGNSNPNMPEAMKGIKFEPGTLTLSFSFTTTLSPVWGDFYAKDGVDKDKVGETTINVTAWNDGFSVNDQDPTDGPANGSIQNHILRPDSKSIYVPDGGTSLLLLGMAVSVIGLIRRRV